MRVLTGRHRAAYESLVEQNGRLMADVKRLEDEVLFCRCELNEWKERWDAERARANRAVDAQLAVRGFPTVTPPTSIPDFPDVLEEDPEAVAKVEARMSQGDATVFAERF